MARPSKLTPDRQRAIVLAIASGSYCTVAALANGVDESTYFRWMKRGKEAPRDPDTDAPVIPEDERYCEFYEAVKEAEAKAEVLAVGRIQQAAAQGTWQASAWYLERKYPDRWGRKDHVVSEVSGPNGGPIEVDAEAATLAWLDGRAAALAGDEEGETGGTGSSSEDGPAVEAHGPGNREVPGVVPG